MIEVLSFQDVLAATDGKDRTLLIGNGFSANHFSYSSLLAASGIAEGTALHNLFDALDTVDFEKVIRALEDAVVVEHAYGNGPHAQELENDAQAVREALVQAINETHPGHRDDLDYGPVAAFLGNFGTVFTLNYDLLLYWAVLEEAKLHDGFGLGSQVGRFRGPFNENAWCQIFNLHGGLHLFANGDGAMIKAVHTGAGVIATITDCIANKKRLPVYVAEGTSRQKMRKVDSNAYLRHCFAKLRDNAASVFVYGHSADDNDAHVYRAIFESKTKRVYFGVYQPDEGKLKILDGQLARFKAIHGQDVSYAFFDSGSANVWGGG